MSGKPLHRSECRRCANRVISHCGKTTSLFNRLVGEGKDRIRDCEDDRLGGSEIEDHVELRSLFNGQIGRLGSGDYIVTVHLSVPKGADTDAIKLLKVSV